MKGFGGLHLPDPKRCDRLAVSYHRRAHSISFRNAHINRDDLGDCADRLAVGVSSDCSLADPFCTLQDLSSTVARSISAHQEGGKLSFIRSSGSLIIFPRRTSVRKRRTRTRTVSPPFHRRDARPIAICIGPGQVLTFCWINYSIGNSRRPVGRGASCPGRHINLGQPASSDGLPGKALCTIENHRK